MTNHPIQRTDTWNIGETRNDRDLIAQRKKGDSSAFEKLVQNWQQSIFNLTFHYLGSHDVESIALKIFTIHDDINNCA